MSSDNLPSTIQTSLVNINNQSPDKHSSLWRCMLLWHKALKFAGWRLFTIIFKYAPFKILHLQRPREEHVEHNREQALVGNKRRQGGGRQRICLVSLT